ncbi:MAG: DegV family protein [Oscillospiraceae bacterium]|nr:DegV family protein [Oscillospiraceae bacterium]
MKTNIIVDSTADLLPELQERVSIVPLTVHFGDEEYIDGVTIDRKSFYEKLIETDVLPSTSQASPAAFEDVFASVSERGEEAVVICVASTLSGTYQSARIAAEDYDNIYIVDSGTAAIGAGILVELALQYLEEGKSAKEIAEALEVAKKRIIIVALLDTLDYLHKGGRIPKTVALAGAVLNIKPVVSIEEGKINLLGKARGSKQGNNILVQQIEKSGGVDFTMPVLLGYTGISDALLQKYISDSRHLWESGLEEIRFSCVGSVIGTHAGPGAVAVAFFKKD